MRFLYALSNYIQTYSLPFSVFILGANISDYFNYGFDEESWNAYCRKQAKLHGMIRKVNAKDRVR